MSVRWPLQHTGSSLVGGGGCQTKVPIATKYCSDCVCCISSCPRPKNKSDFCFSHRAVWQRLPWSMQAARAARAVLPSMLPCDVVAFLQVYPMLEGQLPALIMAAGLKEPTPMFAFVTAFQQLADRNSEGLFEAMRTALRAVDGVPHQAELEQLTRQGAGRWLGAVAWGRALDLIMPEAAACASSPGEVLVLGLRRASFQLARAAPKKFDAMVSVCSKRQQELDALFGDASVLESAEGVVRVIEAVSREAGLAWNAYTIANIVRKFLLARVLHAGAARKVDWASVPLGSLPTRVLPDVKQNLVSGFPLDCSAADASEMVTGRHDQAMLLSMWACLFAEVADMWPKELHNILKLLQGPSCEVAIEQFKAGHRGVSPCPAVLVSMLMKR